MSTPGTNQNAEGKRQEMVLVARRILNGDVGVVAGSREIARLRFDSNTQNDADVLLLVGIDSESDHFPLGEMRRHWNVDVLRSKDEELRAFENRVRQTAYQASERLIAKFENSGER